ncbi:MAG: 50S ribosomal protein L29 [Mycoplasmataceae bacterium]|jgi:large subunit ribosomal protein L29|nr:50S ribosomal protein L29 [Mycoplasmataceae bacterium]
MIKELTQKTSEELVILALRLKLQLLQGRFAAASGALDKPHNLKQIRKTIARINTILTQRNQAISIGSHGVALLDRKTNKFKNLNAEAGQTISAAERDLVKNNSELADIETKADKKIDKKEQKIHLQEKVKELKSQTEVKTPIIRKTVGGS